MIIRKVKDNWNERRQNIKVQSIVSPTLIKGSSLGKHQIRLVWKTSCALDIWNPSDLIDMPDPFGEESSPRQNQNPCTPKQARLMIWPENKKAPDQRWDWSPWLGEIRLPNSIRRSAILLHPTKTVAPFRSGIKRIWNVLTNSVHIGHSDHAYTQSSRIREIRTVNNSEIHRGYQEHRRRK